MRLIKPSSGECADRLSILARKIEEGNARGHATVHWEEEEKEILEYLKAPYDGLGATLRLAAVNAIIWDLEILIMSETPHRLVQAREVAKLNRRRAALVALINGEKESREKL